MVSERKCYHDSHLTPSCHFIEPTPPLTLRTPPFLHLPSVPSLSLFLSFYRCITIEISLCLSPLTPMSSYLPVSFSLSLSLTSATRNTSHAWKKWQVTVSRPTLETRSPVCVASWVTPDETQALQHIPSLALSLPLCGVSACFATLYMNTTQCAHPLPKQLLVPKCGCLASFVW